MNKNEFFQGEFFVRKMAEFPNTKCIVCTPENCPEGKPGKNEKTLKFIRKAREKHGWRYGEDGHYMYITWRFYAGSEETYKRSRLSCLWHYF